MRDVRWSGAPGGDAQPVAVRVHEGALPPGEPVLVDGNSELLGHGVDVPDVEVDQGVGPSVALVLGQVQPDVATCHGDEPGKAGLELVLPLLDEAEPPIPFDSPRRVLDTQNRYDLLVHVPNVTRCAARCSTWTRLRVSTGNPLPVGQAAG